LYNAGIEDEVSLVAWLLSACLAVWMAWANHEWLTPAAIVRRGWSERARVLPLNAGRIAKLFSTLAVPGLIAFGLTIQLVSGRSNLDLNSETNHPGPDVPAGEWARSYTDTQAVVMARLVPTVAHYSERKVIWFPPSSDPHLLMEGIRKYKVNYVIVVRREYNYYLPSDDNSFASLLKAHPDSFRLIAQRPEFRVFQVVSDAATLPPASSPQLFGDAASQATRRTAPFQTDGQHIPSKAGYAA
jgi:hypothetical protein